MTFQRIVEMAIKPPFKYYVVRDGYFGNAVADRFCYNSLSKAKECAEVLFLETRQLYSIYGVKYAGDDWRTRGGWVCGRILSLNLDCSWEKVDWDNIIHVAFVWRYDVRKWNPKLYDKLNDAWLNYEDRLLLKDNYDWESVKKLLGIDNTESKSKTDYFKKDVDKLSKKVLKKFDEFILANEELTMLVQKKYPKIRAEYGIFDRMIMFYEEDENGYKDKEFQSLEEVEKYYKEKN